MKPTLGVQQPSRQQINIIQSPVVNLLDPMMSAKRKRRFISDNDEVTIRSG